MKKKIILALSVILMFFSANIFAGEFSDKYWAFNAEKSQYEENEPAEVKPFSFYLIFNGDLTGLFVDNWFVSKITWDMPNDKTVSFTDRLDEYYEGVYTADYFVVTYQNTTYYMKPAGVPPIIKLAPECWGKGHLPQKFFVESEYFKENIGEEAINELNEKVTSLSERFGFDLQIALISNFKDFSAGSIETLNEEIADGYQLGKENNENALILTMSIDERDYDIYASGGMGNLIFNEYSRTLLENAMLPYFKNNDWIGGFNAYLDKCSDLLELSEKGEIIDGPQGDKCIEAILSLLAGLIVAAIAKSCVKSNYENRVAEQAYAEKYIVDKSFNLTKKADNFSHTSTSKTYSPRTSSSSSGSSSHSGGSRSSSHSSGKF